MDRAHFFLPIRTVQHRYLKSTRVPITLYPRFFSVHFISLMGISAKLFHLK